MGALNALRLGDPRSLWRWFVTGMPGSLEISAEDQAAFLADAKEKFSRDLFLIVAMITFFNVLYWFTDAWLMAPVEGAAEVFNMGRACMVLIGSATWVLHTLFPKQSYIVGCVAGCLAILYIGRMMGLIGPPSSPWFHFLYPFLLILIGQWQTPLERVILFGLFSSAALLGYFSANVAWLADPLLGVSLGYFLYIVTMAYMVSLYVDKAKVRFFMAQRDLERARAHLEDRIHERTQTLHTLVAQMDRLQDAERSRLARDLHDEVGQLLTAQRLALQLVKRRYKATNADIGPNLDHMEELIDESIEQFRGVLRSQRLRILDELGLDAALRHLAQQCRSKLNLACDLRVELSPVDVGELKATTIYRCLQEGITNTAKHAQASRVQVEVVASSEEIRASVRDDGVGISPRSQGGGFGLLGARERVLALDGSLRVSAMPTGGTLFEVRLPVGDGARP